MRYLCVALCLYLNTRIKTLARYMWYVDNVHLRIEWYFIFKEIALIENFKKILSENVYVTNIYVTNIYVTKLAFEISKNQNLVERSILNINNHMT